MRAQGPLGIYRGIGITLLRDCPSYGLYFSKFKRTTYDDYLTYMPLVTYEGLKRTFQYMKGPDQTLSTFDLLMAGGLSGFGAWIPAYPQDVIKSRMQNDPR